MKQIGKVEFNGKKLNVFLTEYATGNKAIQLFDEEGPYMTASVNIDGLRKKEIAIKDYSENEGIYDALVDAEIICEAHRFARTGYVVVPVVTLA